MLKLVDYELAILRLLSGEDMPNLRWGAAMGEAIEFLHGGGYVERKRKDTGIAYVITEKGRAALAQEGEQ